MSDDVLERVRMCVAEAGYDPAQVRRGSIDGRDECGVVYFPAGMPAEAAWRAREMVGMAQPERLSVGPMCRCCSVAIYGKADVVMLVGLQRCLAEEWLTLDCGIAR